MFRALFFILILLNSVAFTQTEEKPKAYIFDEFEKISQAEIKIRTEKFKEKLRENRNSTNFNDGYLFFFYENERELKKTQNYVRDILYKNCLDCFGFQVRITFLNAGKAKKPKTQFWIVPFGAKPPQLIPTAYKFDEFSKISEFQWKRKLNNFAEKITCSQENSFYVIFYPTRKSNWENLGKKYLDRLVRLRCIDPPRIILVKGSVQKIQKTELWIVPSGAEAPVTKNEYRTN